MILWGFSFRCALCRQHWGQLPPTSLLSVELWGTIWFSGLFKMMWVEWERGPFLPNLIGTQLMTWISHSSLKLEVFFQGKWWNKEEKKKKKSSECNMARESGTEFREDTAGSPVQSSTIYSFKKTIITEVLAYFHITFGVRLVTLLSSSSIQHREKSSAVCVCCLSHYHH